jgi:hypothetical protein
MSGPIVRSAPNKKFTQNWEAVFGGKKSTAKASAAPKKTRKKAAKKKKA